MNNEKVEVLFSSIESCLDEQKKATQQLKNATAKANKITLANNESVDLKQLINDISKVNQTAKNIKTVTEKADKVLMFVSFKTTIITFFGAMLLGLTTGVLTYYFLLQDKLITAYVSELFSSTEVSDMRQNTLKIEAIKKYGFEIYSDTIRLPEKYEITDKNGKKIILYESTTQQ